MKNKTDELSNRISLLKNKQSEEWSVLREQFHVTYESLRPVNLIKNTIYEATNSPDLKDNLINNTIGLTTGYLSRKMLLGSTHNPVKKLLGAILQFTITNIVSKHSDVIRSTGENILHEINEYRKKRRPAFHHNGKAGHDESQQDS